MFVHVHRTVIASMVVLAGCGAATSAPAPHSASAVKSDTDRLSPTSAASHPTTTNEGEPAALRTPPSLDAPVEPADTPESVQSQVARLRRAIALYERFIERAQTNPDMRDAVQRSRERIADAKVTIDFLLGESPSR